MIRNVFLLRSLDLTFDFKDSEPMRWDNTPCLIPKIYRFIISGRLRNMNAPAFYLLHKNAELIFCKISYLFFKPDIYMLASTDF